MLAPWEKSYNKPRQHIEKQRHLLAYKGPSSQSYGFSSSHVWMWNLDHNKGWASKNWCSNCGAGEDSWESLGQQVVQISQSKRKSTPNIHWKDWCWSWISSTLAIWCKEPTYWKRPDSRKDWRQEEKGMTEDEMVGWHHGFNGHEFEQIPGDIKGQGSLACCSPWGHKELDTTEWLNNNSNKLNWATEIILGKKK